MSAPHRPPGTPIPIGLLLLPIAAVCAMALGPARVPEARVMAAVEFYAVAAERNRRTDAAEAPRPDASRRIVPTESDTDGASLVVFPAATGMRVLASGRHSGHGDAAPRLHEQFPSIPPADRGPPRCG